jgi:hypothetical protein
VVDTQRNSPKGNREDARAHTGRIAREEANTSSLASAYSKERMKPLATILKNIGSIDHEEYESASLFSSAEDRNAF